MLPCQLWKGSVASLKPPWHCAQSDGGEGSEPASNGWLPGMSKSRKVVGTLPPSGEMMLNASSLMSLLVLTAPSTATMRSMAPSVGLLAGVQS